MTNIDEWRIMQPHWKAETERTGNPSILRAVISSFWRSFTLSTVFRGRVALKVNDVFPFKHYTYFLSAQKLLHFRLIQKFNCILRLIHGLRVLGTALVLLSG